MLSLVAIAKNEADEIREFLQHHAPLADEMVVLDTGSDDNTPALAREAGARVETFTWCDDFAAARNAALETARGTWVLALDIDERIAPRDFPRVRQAMQGERTGYLLPQWNYYDDPRHQEWQPVTGRYPEMEGGHTGFFLAYQYRFLPVMDGLRWEGCVHEDLSASLARLGLQNRLLDVPIHHYGYVRGEQDNARRNAFYGRLVRKKAAANPDDPKAALELAWILIQEGKGREAMPVLEKVAVQAGGLPSVDRARIMLAKMYDEDGRADEALKLMEATVTQSPRWVFGWVSYLQLLSRLERWRDALGVAGRAEAHLGEHVLVLREKFRILVNTDRMVEAIGVGRRVAELAPHLREYAALADKCEALARKAGLI